MSPIFNIALNNIDKYRSYSFDSQTNIQQQKSILFAAGINPDVTAKNPTAKTVQQSKNTNNIHITNIVNNNFVVYKLGEQSPISKKTSSNNKNVTNQAFNLSESSKNPLNINFVEYAFSGSSCECSASGLDPYCEDCEPNDIIDTCAFHFYTDPYMILKQTGSRHFEIRTDVPTYLDDIPPEGINMTFNLTSDEQSKYVRVKVYLRTCSNIYEEPLLPIVDVESDSGTIGGSFHLPQIKDIAYFLIEIITAGCSGFISLEKELICFTETTTTTTPTETTTTTTPTETTTTTTPTETTPTTTPTETTPTEPTTTTTIEPIPIPEIMLPP